jgi:hypothetical protein
MDLSKLNKGEDMLMLDSNKDFYDVFAKFIRKSMIKGCNTILILRSKVQMLNTDSLFVSFRFNKKFNRELSDGENIHLTNKEKRDNLIEMYKYLYFMAMQGD